MRDRPWAQSSRTVCDARQDFVVSKVAARARTWHFVFSDGENDTRVCPTTPTIPLATDSAANRTAFGKRLPTEFSLAASGFRLSGESGPAQSRSIVVEDDRRRSISPSRIPWVPGLDPPLGRRAFPAIAAESPCVFPDAKESSCAQAHRCSTRIKSLAATPGQRRIDQQQ